MTTRSKVIEYRPIRSPLQQTVHDYLAVRRKDGLYGKALRQAVCTLRREPTRVNLRILGVHVLRMMLGDRLMNAVLSDRAVVATGTYRAGESETGVLYHFAPSHCVEKILSDGLVPKHRYVFLTDAPQELEQPFLHWKTDQLHETTAFTLLRVDARRLSQRQAVFCTDREHEFITGKIDAEWISLVPEREYGEA